MTPSRGLTRFTLLACAVVLCGPAVAWLLWVSWSDGKPTDVMHVAWFATVGLSCMLAGALVAVRSFLPLLAVLATVATLVGLWFWWTSEDDSGLFVIGFAIAAPLVAAASWPLVLAGHALGARARRE